MFVTRRALNGKHQATGMRTKGEREKANVTEVGRGAQDNGVDLSGLQETFGGGVGV